MVPPKKEKEPSVRSFGNGRVFPQRPFERFQRYETSIKREMYHAIDQLERQQRRRRGQPPPPTVNVNVSSDDDD